MALETQSDSASDVSAELRFEHYRLLQNAEGKPLELGRGAMGVTYKAVDVNLRCSVEFYKQEHKQPNFGTDLMLLEAIAGRRAEFRGCIDVGKVGYTWHFMSAVCSDVGTALASPCNQ